VVVLAGLPGTVKSTLAEHAAKVLGLPLMSKAIVEATLWWRPTDTYTR
jgi:predicted kinase